MSREKHGNRIDEFDDWLREVWDGRTRESQLTAEQVELAQNAWTHGQEAGYHEGHLDGYRLALAKKDAEIAGLKETLDALGGSFHANAEQGG